MSQYSAKAYEVHIACHELLGHGVGKTIGRNPDGSAPTYTDPVTGEAYQSCYEQGETYNGKFGAFSTSYEECRADTCGLYLCQLPGVWSLFGWEAEKVDLLLWTSTMNYLRKGILGL